VRNQELQNEILKRLKSDYRMKDAGDYLRQGTCPACGHRELYVSKEKPWTARCGRLNRCGAEFSVKDLYKDLFEGFNKRFPKSQEDPNATADAYMTYARGLPVEKLRGAYRQEAYYNPSAIGRTGTATVRFDIDRANEIYMERFVEPITVEDDGRRTIRKQHFGGKHKGLWWQPPGLEIEDGDTVWLVEACIDAASLHCAGVKAVATLSAGNYPEIRLADHADKSVKWVWALDDDRAGRRAATKHVKRMQDAGFDQVVAAFVPGKNGQKRDFNDAFKDGELEPENLKHYLYRGELHLAKTPLEKALIRYRHTGQSWFNFEFKDRLYHFGLDLAAYNAAHQALKDSEHAASMDEKELVDEAAKQAGMLSEIANCYPEFLYFQVNKLTDESWYYTRIRFPHGARPVKNTFTGAQLSAPTEFKKRLLGIAAGSIFTGSKTQLDQFLKDKLHGIKTVETVDFIGYSADHQTYVFNDLAIRNGAAIELNDEDFFELDRLSIKSLNQSVHLHIGDEREYQDKWPGYIWECFGEKGIVAVAFWYASLFAEQIRATQKSFPFLEIVGAPGAGKSTLIEFLWRLVGRSDYEGFDPSKSTPAARARIMSQVANLPVVMIEGDRDEDTAHSKKFDWDELKTAYNGRASRATGVKNNGNDTREPPFRGSLVISQNADVDASEAMLQRIVHLSFDTSGHTPQSKIAAEALEAMPTSAVSAFLRRACAGEKEAVATILERSKHYQSEFAGLDGLSSVRLAKNHAVIMAAVDALAPLVNLTDDQHAAIFSQVCELAVQRQAAISADHPVVREFWETFEFLNEGPDGRPMLNHSGTPGVVAVNLNHFVQVANNRKQQIPPITDLKRHLKASRSRKFQGIKTVRSQLSDLLDKGEGWTCKCWCFAGE